MSNGGLIAGFLNLANPIDQIPMLLAGKMCATDCGFLKEMLLKEPKTEHEKKNPHNDDCLYFFYAVRIPFLTITNSVCYLISCNFWLLENSSMKMRIKNIRIILERLQRITLILIFLIWSRFFRALNDSPLSRSPRK